MIILFCVYDINDPRSYTYSIHSLIMTSIPLETTKSYSKQKSKALLTKNGIRIVREAADIVHLKLQQINKTKKNLRNLQTIPRKIVIVTANLCGC